MHVLVIKIVLLPGRLIYREIWRHVQAEFISPIVDFGVDLP